MHKFLDDESIKANIPVC